MIRWRRGYKYAVGHEERTDWFRTGWNGSWGERDNDWANQTVCGLWRKKETREWYLWAGGQGVTELCMHTTDAETAKRFAEMMLSHG